MGLVTQADIARKYGVSREAVRKWTRKKDFPLFCALGQGNSVLWDEAAVEHWHDNRVVDVGGRPKKVVDTDA